MSLIPTPDETPKPEYEAYYDGATGRYWLKVPSGRYIECNKDSIRSQLRSIGYLNTGVEGGQSEVEVEAHHILVHHNLIHAGPIAGHSAGPLFTDRGLVLVTESPRIIVAKRGSWPRLEKFIGGLLGDQDVYLYSWMKIAYESLRDKTFRAGQVLAFAGEAGCGKTLLQQIIGAFLGGRQENPFRYLSGKTTFNGELFRAEHLAIGDEASHIDLKSRKDFGQQLKQLVAEPNHSCHGKGRQAFSLNPFWRCTICLNSDGQNLMVLPPIDTSLRDKVMLFLCKKDPGIHDEFGAYGGLKEAMVAELPALCEWLTTIEIPGELRDERYGVWAWQHPDLLCALEEHSPEEKMWDLCMQTLFDKEDTVVVTASKLEDALIAGSDFQSKRLFTFPTACGVYLARLMDKRDGRVERYRTRSLWKLTKSSEELPL